MNPFDFPPIAATLEAAASALATVASALDPIAGPSSAALTIVLVTIGVRAALIPLGRAQVRAELARRRLAPRLRELQRRHARQPERLRDATLDLYRAEGTHPLAGMWTLLVQAPVVSLLYAVFTHASIAGHGNVLLSATLAGAPLATSLLTSLAAAPAWPALLVIGSVLTALAATATLARRQQLRLAALDGVAAGPVRMLSLASYLTVVFALFAPLGAGLYLVVSTAWTLAERTILRRVLAGRA